MKRLFMIGGPMGVGKTTACRILKRGLDKCAFLDGDWCWDMHPFEVTPETKRVVMDNICFVLNRFARSAAFDNIIFCWVMHQQAIIDEILARLDAPDLRVQAFSLVCGEAALYARLRRDIDAGLRSPEVIQRSIDYLALYGALQTIKIDVTGRTPEQIASEILSAAHHT